MKKEEKEQEDEEKEEEAVEAVADSPGRLRKKEGFQGKMALRMKKGSQQTMKTPMIWPKALTARCSFT